MNQKSLASDDHDWQNDAPLFAAWRRFVEADTAPFAIPGHKRKAHELDPMLGRLLDADVPLYGGADNTKPTGILADAERRAALCGAPTTAASPRRGPRMPTR